MDIKKLAWEIYRALNANGADIGNASVLIIGDVIDKHTSQPAVEADAQGCGHAYCNLKKSNIGCEEVKCPDRTA